MVEAFFLPQIIKMYLVFKYVCYFYEKQKEKGIEKHNLSSLKTDHWDG